jgi:hypothetical protein
MEPSIGEHGEEHRMLSCGAAGRDPQISLRLREATAVNASLLGDLRRFQGKRQTRCPRRARRHLRLVKSNAKYILRELLGREAIQACEPHPADSDAAVVMKMQTDAGNAAN